MLFWIVITAGIFGVTIVAGDYMKAKRARDKKLKEIAERLKQIENRQKKGKEKREKRVIE